MKIDLKIDLEQLFSDFRWKIKGMIDEDGDIYPIPPIPQVITGIFQELTKHKVKKFLKEKYECEIVQGGPREYPEITLMGGKFGNRKIASRSTGTGTTFAIGSIKEIDKLRKGEGIFKSKEEFENYWRKRGKEREAKTRV